MMRHLLILILGLIVTAFAQAGEMLTIKQVYDIGDSSALVYRISLLDSVNEDSVFKECLRWGYISPLRANAKLEAGDTSQSLRLADADYYQEKIPNGAAIRRYRHSAAVESILKKNDQPDRSANPVERRAVFLEAFALEPANSQLLTRIGDTYFTQKNYKQALSWYQRAIAENYFDYQAHWYLADCYFNLTDIRDRNGYKKKALREIITALVLNRNHFWIRMDVDRICKDAYCSYDEFSFGPLCRITRTADTVKVNAARDWLPYAMTKAVYLYEPAYRDTSSDDTDMRRRFPEMLNNSNAERNCLLNLIAAYYGKDQKRKSDDKAIAAAYKAFKDKNSLEYILYEIWLRRWPHIIYAYPQDKVEQVVDYVMKTHIVSD
jgi:tetratricopeptide (TPR) repeat protein